MPVDKVAKDTTALDSRRDSEASMRALLEAASEAIITVRDDGRITFANQKTSRIFGYQREELLGLPIETLIPERYRGSHTSDRRAYVGAPAERAMGQGRELFALRKDGTEFPVEVSLTPVRTRGGVVVMALVTDISERKATESELKSYANRLGTLHSIDRAILRGETLSETVDGALEKLISGLGCARASVVRYDDRGGTAALLSTRGQGMEVASAGTQFPASDLAEPRRLLAAGGPVVANLSQLEDRTDLIKRFEAAGLQSYVLAPILLKGNLMGILTAWYKRRDAATSDHVEMLSEVADQLAIAIQQADLLESIQQHAAELEQRVEERTGELRQANDELQAFAYTVSHDLRAPLRAMQGFGQALLEDYGDTMDEVATDFTRRIVDAAAHMDELIQDLLAYSRMAQAQLELQPVDVEEVVTAGIAQVDDEVRRRGAKTSVETGGLRVQAHRQTAVQVIANLVGNAVKFVDGQKAPQVAVKAESRDDMVRISVVDNGIGIEPHHVERIFRLFERLHGMEEYPGTGIGLAIVKKGAERMGGRAGVESTAGKGSTFWVELPSA